MTVGPPRQLSSVDRTECSYGPPDRDGTPLGPCCDPSFVVNSPTEEETVAGALHSLTREEFLSIWAWPDGGGKLRMCAVTVGGGPEACVRLMQNPAEVLIFAKRGTAVLQGFKHHSGSEESSRPFARSLPTVDINEHLRTERLLRYGPTLGARLAKSDVRCTLWRP